MKERKYYLCNVRYWDEANINFLKLAFKDFNIFNFKDLRIIILKDTDKMHFANAFISINKENAEKVERMLKVIDAKVNENGSGRYIEIKKGFFKKQ